MSYRAYIFVGVCVVCFFAQCKSNEPKHRSAETYILEVPDLIWPGSRNVPEMDGLLQSLRASEKTSVQLVFHNPKVMLISPDVFEIRRGSVYLYGKHGYFRLDNNKRVYANLDGKTEVDLKSSITDRGARLPVQQIEFSRNAIWCGKSSNANLELTRKAMVSKKIDGNDVANFSIRLTDDFEGNLSGWKFSRGM